MVCPGGTVSLQSEPSHALAAAGLLGLTGRQPGPPPVAPLLGSTGPTARQTRPSLAGITHAPIPSDTWASRESSTLTPSSPTSMAMFGSDVIEPVGITSA